VISNQPIARIQVFRNSEIVKTIEPGTNEAHLDWTDEQRIPRGTFYYLRVIEASADKAWASPVWLKSQTR